MHRPADVILGKFRRRKLRAVLSMLLGIMTCQRISFLEENCAVQAAEVLQPSKKSLENF